MPSWSRPGYVTRRAGPSCSESTARSGLMTLSSASSLCLRLVTGSLQLTGLAPCSSRLPPSWPPGPDSDHQEPACFSAGRRPRVACCPPASKGASCSRVDPVCVSPFQRLTSTPHPTFLLSALLDPPLLTTRPSSRSTHCSLQVALGLVSASSHRDLPARLTGRRNFVSLAGTQTTTSRSPKTLFRSLPLFRLQTPLFLPLLKDTPLSSPPKACKASSSPDWPPALPARPPLLSCRPQKSIPIPIPASVAPPHTALARSALLSS
jgi:hypothetical protein